MTLIVGSESEDECVRVELLHAHSCAEPIPREDPLHTPALSGPASSAAAAVSREDRRRRVLDTHESLLSRRFKDPHLDFSITGTLH